MSYVVAMLQTTICNNGNIVATLSNMEVKDGPRPKTAEEIGSNSAVLKAINARIPGQYETIVRPGAGMGLFINADGLNKLRWDGRREKIEERYGKFDGAMITIFKDLDAPSGAWWKADIAAGILNEARLVEGAFRELAEFGFMTEKGWLRFITNGRFSQFQPFIDEQQRFEWDRLKRTSSQICGTISQHGQAELNILPGRDTVNGWPCLFTTEPLNGSSEFNLLASVELGCQNVTLLDTEHWVPQLVDIQDDRSEPLLRSFLVIANRSCKYPVAFLFPSGKSLNTICPPVILDKENTSMLLTEKAAECLRYLGWI